MLTVIDTHTHLFDEAFDEDREEVYSRAKEAGVGRLYLPNIDDTTIDALLSFTQKHSDCYPLMGFHPTSVDQDWKLRLPKVKETLYSMPCFKGIGEVGLDLYWDKTFMAEQMEVLDIQIQWALDLDLPIIIHCREAHNELLQVFSPYKQEKMRGIFHSFSGTIEEAHQLLAFPGFMLGVNGIVTFKKSTLPEVLKDLPLNRIVLETDSPYLAPVPFRGKRNETAHVVKVADRLAEIYGQPIAEVAKVTTANALKVFENEC